MKKRKIIKLSIITIFVFSVFFVTFFYMSNTTYAQTLKEINLISNEIIEYIDELNAEKNEKSYYSSPYAIIKDMNEYDKLTSLGIKAIKPLYDKINYSTECGLMEYIYAIAIEEIMNQHFTYNKNSQYLKNLENYAEKNKIIDYGWANSNEFKEAFKTYINDVPSEYEKIKENQSLNNDEKKEEIIKLGLAAVPYIIDDINNKNIELQYENILIDLLLEKNQINPDEEINTTAWITRNQEVYYMLKEIN